jgi:GNAT superfamily N-acetyltransferase
MTVAQLTERMRGWIESGEYVAVLFEELGDTLAYALFREQPTEIYLRQFLVVRHRRREGRGRTAMQLLRTQLWPANKRLTLDVLTANAPAIAFYRSLGYVDYCLTMEIVSGSAP